MKIKIPCIRFWIAAFSILITAFIIKQSAFYRWFSYDRVPVPVADEYDYAWQGISLRRYGLPVGWSLWVDTYMNPKYGSKIGSLEGFVMNNEEGKVIDLQEFNKSHIPYYAIEELNLNKGKEQMFFAMPFFDHSPFGGLIYSLGVDDSITNVDQVETYSFRRPALVLAIITSILLFIFTYLISSNPWVGVLSVLVYSTVPTYLLATRMAFLENVVPPFVLVQLIFLFLAIKKHPHTLLYFLSGLFSGLAFLAKEPAISFFASSVLLLFIFKTPRKSIFAFLIGSAVPVLIYGGWAFWLNKDLFLGVFLVNAGRDYFGAIKPLTMLEALKFENFPTDGWWIWGILSFLFLAFKTKRKDILFLVVPLAFHLLLIFLLGSPNYPWYLLSAIPLLAGCAGLFIWRIPKNPTYTSALAFFMLPFSSSYYWGRTALLLAPSINHYRYSFLVFATVLFLRIRFSKHLIVRLVWILFMIYMLRKIYIYNQVFFPYLVAHWGNLPIKSLPNY